MFVNEKILTDFNKLFGLINIIFKYNILSLNNINLLVPSERYKNYYKNMTDELNYHTKYDV